VTAYGAARLMFEIDHAIGGVPALESCSKPHYVVPRCRTDAPGKRRQIMVLPAFTWRVWPVM
jgi:hypothetical protein